MTNFQMPVYRVHVDKALNHNPSAIDVSIIP